MGIGSAIGGGATIAIVIKAIDNYSNELKKFEKRTKKSATKMQKFGVLLKKTGIGYTALAAGAIAFGTSAVKAAIESERAMQQFELAVGDASDTMLDDMRRASKGMISDFNLVNDANRALALGISKNQIPALLKVATARAKVFGRTASEAFNDLAIGIGRGSRMILDNLGIILDLDVTYDKYAETIGKVGSELTELEKKEALVVAILKDSEGLVKSQIFLQETHAEKLERLSTGFANLRQNIGLYMMDMFDSASGLKTINELQEKQIDQMTGIPGTFNEASRSVMDLTDAQRGLSEELTSSKDAAQKLINSLLNIKDITFAGERKGTLAIAEQKEVVRMLELEAAGGLDVADALDIERNNLNILRLEQEEFANEREIQQAQNAIQLENEGILESLNLSQFQEGQKIKFDALLAEEKKQGDIISKLGEIKVAQNNLVEVFDIGQEDKFKGYDEEKKKIDELIKKTEILTAKYQEAANARKGAGVGGLGIVGTLTSLMKIPLPGKSRFVGDAIMRPNGEVIETHPQDTLIATKNPGGMGATIIIEGNNIYGTDPDDIANALQEKLSDKIKY